VDGLDLVLAYEIDGCEPSHGLTPGRLSWPRRWPGDVVATSSAAPSSFLLCRLFCHRHLLERIGS
jgi:hypothetical protein